VSYDSGRPEHMRDQLDIAVLSLPA
jgi:hypothetical protein